MKKNWNVILAKVLVVVLFLVATIGSGGVVYAAAPGDENYDDDAGYSNATTQFTIDGLKYTLTGPGPDTLVTNMAPSGWGELGDGGSDNFISIMGIDTLKIEAADGSYFKLNGFEMGFCSVTGITITPETGAAISRARAGDESYYTIDVSANTDFQYIRYFTISGTDMIMNIDDIDFSPAVPPTHTVTYNGNGNTGGSAPSDVSSPYTEGDTVTVLGNSGTLVKTGYSFAGWNTAANGSGTDYAPAATFAMGTGNVTLYAKWAPLYTVTYNGNANTGGSVPTDGNSYLSGDLITVLDNTGTLVRTGYTFVGWNTASNGSGTSRAPASTFAMGASNVTLYAQWTPVDYTITYNGNTNTGGSVPTDGNTYHITDTVTVLGNTGTLVKTGYTFAGWNTESGTSYSVGNTFAMGSSNVTLYAKWVAVSSGGGSSTPAPTPTPTVVNIQVNEDTEPIATAKTETDEGKVVTTVTLDNEALEEKLKDLKSNATVGFSVNNQSDVVVGVLNGQTIKSMENREAVLEIRTENVTYTLPASEINIDAVSNSMGTQVALKDIRVNLSITKSSQETNKIVEDTASKYNYQVVVKPVEFEITCTNGGTTVTVSRFNGYVERTVAIPDGIDPSKITTGIVLNADGTFSHVPTAIVVIDGKYYARINSLTNSIYSVIYSPKTYADIDNHWGELAMNDMASRLVMMGVDDEQFEPDEDMTRAEFTDIVVKALGLLRTGAGKDTFVDVTKNNPYYDAVSIAKEYGIVSGYGNVSFRPDDKITREQAMMIIWRAMRLTKLEAGLKQDEISSILAGFKDGQSTSSYAKEAVAACVKTGIVVGGSSKKIMPSVNMTRAQVATIVHILLMKSKLI